MNARYDKTFPTIKTKTEPVLHRLLFRGRCCAIHVEQKIRNSVVTASMYFMHFACVICLFSAVSSPSWQGFHTLLGCFLLYLSACNSSVHATIRSHPRQNRCPTSSSCFTLHVRRALQQSMTASGRIQFSWPQEATLRQCSQCVLQTAQ